MENNVKRNPLLFGLLEQGTQTPSPAPDLTSVGYQPRTYIVIGTANGALHLRDLDKELTIK
jgi:hypothetical protein